MKIAALDLSLTATGYATGGMADPGFDRGPEQLGTIKTNGVRGVERLDEIRGRTLEVVDGADIVVLEGYAFARPNRAHQLGELGGVIRLALHDLGFPFVDIAPAALKKYATGKGNAGKDQVLVATVHRLDYLGHDNNEADALWLLEMAMDHYGIVKSLVPKAHRAALEKVEWPSF